MGVFTILEFGALLFVDGDPEAEPCKSVCEPTRQESIEADTRGAAIALYMQQHYAVKQLRGIDRALDKFDERSLLFMSCLVNGACTHAQIREQASKVLGQPVSQKYFTEASRNLRANGYVEKPNRNLFMLSRQGRSMMSARTFKDGGKAVA